MATPTLSYCGQLVRTHDHDRFLTALFAPPDKREGLFALYALNLELARVAELVREPMLGQIRLQWWQEALQAALSGQTDRHALLPPLAQAMLAAGLSAEDLLPLVQARSIDLDPQHRFATLTDVEAYAASTGGLLCELAARLLVPQADSHTRQAAQLVGTGWALMGLARSVPFHARQRRIRLPMAVLQAANVDAVHLLDRRPPHAGLGAAITCLAVIACDYVEKSRQLRPVINPAAISCLLMATLVDNHMKILKSVDFDPFDPRRQRGHFALQLRLLFQSWRGYY